jgi:hypothetical protein
MTTDWDNPSYFELECYNCGNKWQRKYYGDLEQFMAKHKNYARKCPKCGELGIPTHLREEMKQNLKQQLEPYEQQTFEPGDIVEVGRFLRRRQGVVVFVRDWNVAVHFSNTDFKAYEMFPETALRLVKKREKPMERKIAALAECYQYLTTLGSDERLDETLEEMKNAIRANHWYNVGKLFAKFEVLQGWEPTNAMTNIMSFKTFYDPFLSSVKVPMEGWKDFARGYSRGRGFSLKQIEKQLEMVERSKEYHTITTPS